LRFTLCHYLLALSFAVLLTILFSLLAILVIFLSDLFSFLSPFIVALLDKGDAEDLEAVEAVEAVEELDSDDLLLGISAKDLGELTFAFNLVSIFLNELGDLIPEEKDTGFLILLGEDLDPPPVFVEPPTVFVDVLPVVLGGFVLGGADELGADAVELFNTIGEDDLPISSLLLTPLRIDTGAASFVDDVSATTFFLDVPAPLLYALYPAAAPAASSPPIRPALPLPLKAAPILLAKLLAAGAADLVGPL
jgi:hypothetical protein